MSYLLREIKLTKLTETPLSDEASKLIKFWDGLWTDMKVIVDAGKGEIKCWKEGYEYYYFIQKDENDYLRCDIDEVWSFFMTELKINFNDTQELIQYMVVKTLNSRVSTAAPAYDPTHQKVDKTLNSRVNTANGGRVIKSHEVNKTSKCMVNTAKLTTEYIDIQVGETPHCVVNTPYIKVRSDEGLVDKASNHGISNECIKI